VGWLVWLIPITDETSTCCVTTRTTPANGGEDLNNNRSVMPLDILGSTCVTIEHGVCTFVLTQYALWLESKSATDYCVLGIPCMCKSQA
jgi:hypothetical protein